MENVGDKETISPSPGLNELDLVVPQSPARNNSCFICKKNNSEKYFQLDKTQTGTYKTISKNNQWDWVLEMPIVDDEKKILHVCADCYQRNYRKHKIILAKEAIEETKKKKKEL